MNTLHELDKLIAQKIFNIFPIKDSKPYSTNISAAWEVVDQMKKLGWFSKHSYDDGLNHYNFYFYNEKTFNSSSAQTIALAICMAALYSIGELK